MAQPPRAEAKAEAKVDVQFEIKHPVSTAVADSKKTQRIPTQSLKPTQVLAKGTERSAMRAVAQNGERQSRAQAETTVLKPESAEIIVTVVSQLPRPRTNGTVQTGKEAGSTGNGLNLSTVGLLVGGIGLGALGTTIALRRNKSS